MGDILMTTDNPILLNSTAPTPAIMCVQRKAKKKVITNDMLVQSNMDGFGDAIGTTTNHITAMFDILALFEKDSKEYETISYRIKCGQLYQQNCIDRVKGIISKPMPSYWYRHDRIKDGDSPEIVKLKEFNNSIVAEKKPYFMNYIYPQQMDIYNKYIKATNKKCLREFKITMPELIAKQNKNDIEKTFLKYYYKFLPVSDNGCVMNRLCHIVEREFDGYISEIKSKSDFDYSILKSNVDYDKTAYNNIKRLYMEYQRDVKNYIVQAKTQHISHEDTSLYYQTLKKEYAYRCNIACPNPEMLCDIILDICYTNSNSKQFAWDVCGETFINNLLKINDNTITYLETDNSGNIEYNGMKFIKKQKKVEVDV